MTTITAEGTATMDCYYQFPIDWEKVQTAIENNERELVLSYFSQCTHDISLNGIIFEPDEKQELLETLLDHDMGLCVFNTIVENLSVRLQVQYLRKLSEIMDMVNDCDLSESDIQDLFNSSKFTSFFQKYSTMGAPIFCACAEDFWEASEDYNENLTEFLDLESYMDSNIDERYSVQTNSGFWIFS